jgi:2-keto-4-pentenoate hydratase/2-oxohepta-3-ene-1,7-dioic acid hydratase in catechol pathway
VRLAVFGPQHRVGVVHEDRIVDACAAYASYIRERGEPLADERAAITVPAELGDFIVAGEAAIDGAGAALGQLLASERAGQHPPNQLSWRLESVQLHAPLARRARMFLAGSNYAAHTAGIDGVAGQLKGVREGIRAAGLRGFISFTENCVGSDAPIIYPARTDMLDFEGEVAAVIGRQCKDVAAADAADLFWGFFLLNDLSARRAVPIADNPGSRFARDKNFDSGKAAGPFIAIAELGDAQDIRWETRVNGELRQSGHTADMVFSFAEMVEHLSADMTLYPGDIISGGTPGGTGMDSAPRLADGERDPSAFLQVGDVVEVSNPLLGTLRNPIVAKH